MRRWLDRTYSLCGALAAIALAGIGVVMVAQAVGRELIGVQIRGADDMAAWLCAASAFLGLASTFRNGELVRVGLWVGMLKGKARWWAEVFALAVTTVFVGWGTWAVTRFVYESWAMKEINQGLLQWPIWIPQSTLVVGMLVFLVAVLDAFAQVLRRQVPVYQAAEDDRMARGDFSAVA